MANNLDWGNPLAARANIEIITIIVPVIRKISSSTPAEPQCFECLELYVKIVGRLGHCQRQFHALPAAPEQT